MKQLTNAEIFAVMEKYAPMELAYEWDNVGLEIGSYSNQVRKVMVSLDVLESVVDEAIEKKVDLIIAHHPLLFKPLKQVNVDNSSGKVIQKLLQHNITVYAAHTNLDAADGGVNDVLCDLLEIRQREILLDPHVVENIFKIVVFVPETHADDVRNALSENGAGYIGNYSHCTFQTTGTGTFMPLEGTNPFIGSKNKLKRVHEYKIETIIQESKLSAVLQAMIKTHPYEEPAYDIYPTGNNGKSYGIGRIGSLPENMSLREFCEHAKTKLDVPSLRVTGDLEKVVKKIAVLGGSGEKYYQDAIRKGADAYVTGDMTFHMAQDAWQQGLAVIDPGHHIEKVMKKAVKQYLDQQLQDTNVEVIISTTNTEPFQFV